MARKPRRSTHELIDERLANVSIDAGEYGVGENAAPQARGPGKPSRPDWPPIDVMIDWFLANPDMLPLASFIHSVRVWSEKGGKKPPHARTLERRIKQHQPRK